MKRKQIESIQKIDPDAVVIIEHEDLLRCPKLDSPNVGDWFCSNHFLLKSRCTATCSEKHLLTVQLIDNSFENRQIINDNSTTRLCVADMLVTIDDSSESSGWTAELDREMISQAFSGDFSGDISDMFTTNLKRNDDPQPYWIADIVYDFDFSAFSPLSFQDMNTKVRL